MISSDFLTVQSATLSEISDCESVDTMNFCTIRLKSGEITEK